MIYIPIHLRTTKGELVIIEMKESIDINDIVKVHYAYRRTFSDFDGGLSLFDSLKKKLSLYFDNVKDWDINKMKDQIRNSPHPQDEYMLILDEIMTQEMVDVYGY